MTETDEKDIAELLARIERLEEAVFTQNAAGLKPSSLKYTGVKGGVLNLIDQGFMDSKRFTLDVSEELGKQGYHYRREVIQTALNRLSAVNGPLTAFIEEGKKVYVKRK